MYRASLEQNIWQHELMLEQIGHEHNSIPPYSLPYFAKGAVKWAFSGRDKGREGLYGAPKE